MTTVNNLAAYAVYTEMHRRFPHFPTFIPFSAEDEDEERPIYLLQHSEQLRQCFLCAFQIL